MALAEVEVREPKVDEAAKLEVLIPSFDLDLPSVPSRHIDSPLEVDILLL